MNGKNRLVVAITGASGAILGIEVLRALRAMPDWETHLILSSGARRTIQAETDYTPAQVEALADALYPMGDIGATIASGSFQTAGMIVAPCSMKTLAGIANGFSENLVLRAADVMLKERRRLVLVPRETPYNRIHLRNMMEANDAGAILLPPALTYYHRPKSIEDMTHHIVGKILDLFGIQLPDFARWEGETRLRSAAD